MSRSRSRPSAAAEVRRSDATIQKRTALSWAARAIACYNYAVKAAPGMRARWIVRGQSYYDEALEHAALVGDSGRTVAKLQKKLDAAKKRVK